MIDLKVRNTSKIITMPNHTAEYELHIQTMHGDGDVYKEESYFYDSTDSFYRDAYLLAHFFSKDCPQRYMYEG
jgi:hypothetical protein